MGKDRTLLASNSPNGGKGDVGKGGKTIFPGRHQTNVSFLSVAPLFRQRGEHKKKLTGDVAKDL